MDIKILSPPFFLKCNPVSKVVEQEDPNLTSSHEHNKINYL